ncbi:forespore regulator of the sigma-K checkpoint [Salirhabdus euzebyi]|uniref:Forespore regulator of the sigma-K checkpoint n=1 Tax=Salirhabdus euzebyi TaxID=394506 RepID=A0A841PYB3_9BACI|nr:BofC C-terminal domain-containing protein [Salirhabdus euzebyi]MBB6451901.1 forespore regulator of the sigma-K checkpoint [Salirhabdus euzebyi]
MNKKTSIFPMVALLLLIITSFQVFAEGTNEPNKAVVKEREQKVEKEEEKKAWEREPLELEVVLQTKYLDGSVEEEVRQETVWSLQDFWAGYESWNLVEQSEGKVVFQKKVDDLSPSVKQNGYFGLDEDNVLSIFNGKPQQNKVIKAFYEIDVGKLESHRMDQLKAGIKIEKRSTFEDVMKTYRDYASSEPVLDES